MLSDINLDSSVQHHSKTHFCAHSSSILLIHALLCHPPMDEKKMSSRPSTAGSRYSAQSPGRRSPGVKGTLMQLTTMVAEHDALLSTLTKKEELAADNGNEMFERMERKFEGIMESMRAEMTEKLQAAYSEIERLNKKVSIMKSEQEIQKSQLKDQSRSLTNVEEAVADLTRDINGDGLGEYD